MEESPLSVPVTAAVKSVAPAAKPEKPPALSGLLQWLLERSGLALAPAAGYFLVFKYESAYCSVFGIPSTLVQPSLTTVLIFVTIVIASLPLLLNLFETFLWARNADEVMHPVSRALTLYTAPAMILVLLFLIARPHLFRFWLYGGLIMGLVILDIAKAPPKQDAPKKALIYRIKGPFHWYSDTDSVARSTRSLFGKNWIFVLAIYLASIAATALGEAEAYQQKDFLIPASKPNSIVVRVYDSHAICVYFDPVSKKALKRYYVTSIDAKDFGDFELKTIGPLSF